MTSFKASGERRHRAARGTCHKRCCVQRERAPSPLRREQDPQLILADLPRRVRNRGVEGEAQQIVPAAGGERCGKLAREAFSFERPEQVKEAGIDNGSELTPQE